MKMRLSLLCFLLLMPAAVARAQDVTVEFDKSANFSSFKTYSWTRDGVPAKNPFIDQQIVASVDKNLAAKGLNRVEKGGDLTVLYLAATDVGVQVAASRWVTTGNWMTPITSGITVRNQMWDVSVGTIVVCLSDASGTRLLWRGVAKTMLENKSKKQNAYEALTEDAKKMEKKVSRAIDKMFKQYSPGKAAG